jgi:acyl-CoA thioester hydrolase
VLEPPRGAFSYAIEVRFRDLDALGHVNNAVYLTYLESARIAYWMALTGNPDMKRLDMILARVEVDYRSPVHYGEHLDISVWCSHVGRTSFVLEFRISERKTGRLVAEARKVLVHYDHDAGKSSVLPPELRKRLEPVGSSGS